MDSLKRTASLEEDLYMPHTAFSDHGRKSNVSHMTEILFGTDHQSANYQRFSRIASAQEMEDFDSFYDSTEEASDYALSPDSGVHDMTQMDPEARAKAEEEWTRELAKTEEEINTLRQVLSSKIRRMQDLKRKLGITVWKEFREDMEQGIKNLQESTAYQKTSQTLKTATEKTSEALGTIGASVSQKFQEVKQFPAFKSLEEKVGSAYSSVKTKVSGTPRTDEGNSGEALLEKSNESQIPAENQK